MLICWHIAFHFAYTTLCLYRQICAFFYYIKAVLIFVTDILMSNVTRHKIITLIKFYTCTVPFALFTNGVFTNGCCREKLAAHHSMYNLLSSSSSSALFFNLKIWPSWMGGPPKKVVQPNLWSVVVYTGYIQSVYKYTGSIPQSVSGRPDPWPSALQIQPVAPSLTTDAQQFISFQCS